MPYIEGDLSSTSGLLLEDLEAQVDATVVAQLANKRQYTLVQATCRGGFELNTRDGQLRVRWEGLYCEEVVLG